LPEGGDVNKLLRLIGRGKALAHMVAGKRESIFREQAAREAGTDVRYLEWYLADNISDTSVRRPKKARTLMSRVPR